MGEDVISSYVYRDGPGFPVRFFSVAMLWAIAWVFIASALLMWLWNITMPKLFKLTEITYWEAFRLLLIAGLLFGRGFSFTMG